MEKLNNNEDTEFTIGFPIEYNSNSIPNIKKISEMQPIRVLKGNCMGDLWLTVI